MFCQNCTIIMYFNQLRSMHSCLRKECTPPMNTHSGTTRRVKRRFITESFIFQTRQSSLVPTSSLPAQGYLTLIVVFPPSCLFLPQSAQSFNICDPQSVFSCIFGRFSHYAKTVGTVPIWRLLSPQYKRR